METDSAQLEPRIAKIEGQVAQLNSSAAGVEAELRDFRGSMDKKFDRLDARLVQLNTDWDAKFALHDAKWEAKFEKLDLKWEAKFEKLDAKWDARLERLFDRLDTKIERVDAKFERKLEALSTRRFSVGLAITSSVATIVAAALAFILSNLHWH